MRACVYCSTYLFVIIFGMCCDRLGLAASLVWLEDVCSRLWLASRLVCLRPGTRQRSAVSPHHIPVVRVNVISPSGRLLDIFYLIVRENRSDSYTLRSEDLSVHIQGGRESGQQVSL